MRSLKCKETAASQSPAEIAGRLRQRFHLGFHERSGHQEATWFDKMKLRSNNVLAPLITRLKKRRKDQTSKKVLRIEADRRAESLRA